jgi:signal transduction histidine kinase
MTERVDTYQAASILVVDDNSANLRTLAQVLGPLGHDIVVARTCAEALDLTRAQVFAVILSDVRIGSGPPFEAFSALRARAGFATPVIVLSSAHDSWEYAHRAYALGALDYIVKPVDPLVIRAKVAALVLLHRRGAELEKRASIITRQSAEIEAQQSLAQASNDRQSAEMLQQQSQAQASSDRQTAEMVEERSQAQASSDNKDRTLSIVSHDLRNPLNSIVVGAALLQQLPDSSPRHQVIAGRIARSAKRMELMIRDLLDYARGRFSGGMSVVPRLVDLEEICEAVVAELRTVHPKREITLQSVGRLDTTCDGARVEQAISNLIGNALEHSASAISVTATGGADMVEVKVHNGPPGIAPAKLPIIFEAFRRGDQSGGGLGLGLHIVRQIALAHGGDVSVVSDDQHGTTFTVQLPRSRPA